MTENIYKPPEADLALEGETGATQFYVVSKKKLMVLFVATFGLYIFYWFFVNWRNHRDFTGNKLMPIPRSIFYVFFTHSLFEEVATNLKTKQLEHDWSPKLLATMFVIFAIASNVLDRLSSKEIGSPVTDILSIATLPFLLFIMLKAQAAINISQDDPLGSSNSKFTLQNYLFIGLGVLLWIVVSIAFLAIFGFLPTEA